MTFEKMFVVRDPFDILVKKISSSFFVGFFPFFIKFRSLISSNIKFILGNKDLFHHRVTGNRGYLKKSLPSLYEILFYERNSNLYKKKSSVLYFN